MAKTHAPIRIGIVGLGRAGWGMQCAELDQRKDTYQIVAGCDLIPQRCGRMEKRYGCPAYTDIAELLADECVELVSVATRSPDHVPHALAALKAGKIVFVEKPMAVTLSGARKLAAAAKKYSGKVFIRHNRRFEPGFQHVREIIASGVLGNVYEIKLRRNGYGRRDDWQAIRECGGGQLLNWGPHIIDHALRFLESPVADMWSDLRTVSAVGSAEDHVRIVLRGKNGRVADLEISGGAALGEPEHLVLGDRGALVSEGGGFRLRYIDPKQKLSRRKADPGTPGMDSPFHRAGNREALRWVEQEVPVAPKLACDMDGIWDPLFATIRCRKKFPVSIDEAVAVMEIIHAARKGTAYEALPEFGGR